MIFITVVACCLYPARASAATITLNGSCSIDDAITNANNDDQSGSVNCTAGAGDDIINIPAGTWSFGTNNVVSSNISFIGAGPGTSILDGLGTYSGLFCDGGAGTQFNMSLSQLVIRDTTDPGYLGRAAVAAQNCNVNMIAIEIFGVASETATSFVTSDDTDMSVIINGLYVHDSVGPGLYFFEAEGSISTLTSTVEGYTASDMTAGQIGMSGGIVTVTRTGNVNTTVRNSTLLPSVSTGIGVYIMSNAESVTNANATISLINTTIAGNGIGVLPASGVFASSSANVGLSAATTVNFQNVLIAGNNTGSGIVNCAGQNAASGGSETITFASQGNNLSDDSSCNLVGSGDQENVSNLLTTLGPLQDNGGFTPTRALLFGSPAIDAGATIAGLTDDQRGVARPQHSGYDIGAYEYDEVSQQGGGNQQGGGEGSQGSSQAESLADTGENTRWILIVSILSITLGLVGSIFALRRQKR